MHCGSLDGESAAARVYRVLRQNPGKRFSGPELARAAARDPDWPLTAVSTRASEVRAQLPPSELLITERVGDGFYYALELRDREPALW